MNNPLKKNVGEPMTNEELLAFNQINIGDDPNFNSDIVQAILLEKGVGDLSNITNTSSNLKKTEVNEIDANMKLLNFIKQNITPSLLRIDINTETTLREDVTNEINLNKNVNGFFANILTQKYIKSAISKIKQTNNGDK